ncbi:MAG: InlB B-repeat-containing protein [Lachnospiraceae bacterium]|nr:InlB B-repeat-containing protein [Lachnospiraceae bacterium]
MSRRCMGCMEMIENETVVCPHCGYAAGTPAEEAIHMEPGSFLHDRYIVGRVLGYGGFGVTYIGWDGRLEQKVAIKEYLPGEFSTRMPGRTQVTVFGGDKSEQFRDGMKKFVEEARHLAKFQNEPGIVKIFDAFEENDTAYIVMEYLDGMTLTEYLNQVGTIPEDDAVDMLMPIMASLQTVHAEGLLHRDIAPDNIFITKKGEIKLIDFGASRYATTSHSRSLTVIIKPGYSPEEQYRSRGDQGPHTDVYALSAVLYKMITGKTPPDAMERRAKFENQNKDILTPPHALVKDISQNRENAILNALNVRIEDRTPDVATFMKELNSDEPVKLIGGRIKKLDLYSWPTWLKVLVPSLLALVVAFGALLATGVIDLSRYSNKIVIPNGVVVVPEVEGLSSDEAIKLIEEQNLLAVTAGSVASEYIEAGLIVLQDPMGGSYLQVSSPVRLTVSSGAGVVGPVDGMSTVPYVLWDEKEDAVSKLSQAGLVAEIEEEYDENVAAGQVIAQSEKAGTQLKEGSFVTLTVSKGMPPFPMPNVVGKMKEEAETELIQAGLSVETGYDYDDKVEEGRVISQSVEAGTDITRGSSVKITVSSGARKADVPDVTGKDQSEAKGVLEEAGFTVKTAENYDDNVAAGVVISQTPEAGTTQLYGSEVTVIVSKGKKPVETTKAPQTTRAPETQPAVQTRTLTFNANGGSVSPGSRTVNVGASYGSLPTPTRSGYTFQGWFTAASGGSQVSGSTKMGSSNTTIYAHWQVIETQPATTETPLVGRTLVFNANGGSVSPTSKSVVVGKTYGDLPTPTYSGYTFLGWYNKAEGGSKVTKDTTVASGSGNITIYAHWEKIVQAYTLTFNANGGSVSPSSRTVNEGSAYGDLPTPSRTGYEFQGWYTAASGGSQVSASTTMGSGNTTVYAHWAAYVYKVTLNANGGSVSPSSINVVYGEAYGSLPTPTRSGYTFQGWYTAASGGSQVSSSTTMGAGDVTIYAHWTAATVTVPSFAGKTESTATSWCTSNGLTYTVNRANNYEVAKGYVVSNTTGSVAVGSKITINVSNGAKAFATGDKVWFKGGLLAVAAGSSSGNNKEAHTMWICGGPYKTGGVTYYQLSYNSSLTPKYGWTPVSNIEQRTN